jgi:hypothetical protein
MPCCYSVQTVWTFHLQPKNVMIKIHKTLILAVVLLIVEVGPPSNRKIEISAQ